MGVTALVMAGGKGSRMALPEEKPLLLLDGKPMIQHVIRALMNVRAIERIVVAVSEHTPRTAKFAKRVPVEVIETPGEDYVSDAQYAIRRLKLDTVLVISADLPLVTNQIIDRIVERYKCCQKQALAVMVPIETRDRLGLERGYVIEAGTKHLVPAGINLINGGRIDEHQLEEEPFIIDEEAVAMNVNTPQELGIAQRLFMRKLCRNEQC